MTIGVRGAVSACLAMLCIVLFPSFAGTARAAESYACQNKPGDPNDAVFKIINAADKSERGTAFVVDSHSQLLLSAAHLMAGGATPEHLVLEKDGETFEFEILARGGNTYYLLEDWVLLRAKIATGQSNFALQSSSLHLAYDPPSLTSLGQSFVLGDARTAMPASFAQVHINPVPTKVCQPDQTLFIEANSYREGHSGSPIYSPEQCGVVAVSSRWALPDQIDDAERRKLIEALKALTEQGDAELRNTAIDPNAAVEVRYEALKGLLKTKKLVRLVPTKCVVDALISGSWNNTAPLVRDLLRARPSDQGRIVLDGLEKLPDLRDSEYFRLIGKLRPAQWSWLDLLQFHDRISRARMNSAWIAKSEVRSRLDGLWQRLGSVELPEQYSVVYTAYADLTGDLEPGPSDTAEARTSVSNVARNFVATNGDWQPRTASNFFGVTSTRTLHSTLSAKEQIAFGSRLAKAVDSDQTLPSDLSSETRKWLADASVAYLASGLAIESASSPTQPSAKDQSAILADLAQATSTQAALKDAQDFSAIKVRDLSTRLAGAALPTLDTSDLGRQIVATRLSGTASQLNIGSDTTIDFTRKTCSGTRCDNLIAGGLPIFGIEGPSRGGVWTPTASRSLNQF